MGETFDKLAAMDPHGAIEFGEAMVDEVAELGGIAPDALGKFGAVAGKHVLEGL